MSIETPQVGFDPENDATAPQEEPRDVAAPAGDRLEHIKARAAKIAADKSLTLVVPGYDGCVGIRYKGIPSAELDKFVQRASKAGEQGKIMAANADLLVRCCDEILVRQNEDAAWESFDLQSTEPTTFSSATLPKLMPDTIGHASSARQEVFGLFSPDDSQLMAVGQHADALINWLQGNAQEIDHALLGE